MKKTTERVCIKQQFVLGRSGSSFNGAWSNHRDN